MLYYSTKIIQHTIKNVSHILTRSNIIHRIQNHNQIRPYVLVQFTCSWRGNSLELPSSQILYQKRETGWPQINGTTNILPDLISKEATQFKWPSPPLHPSSSLSPPLGDGINCFLRNWNYVFKSYTPSLFSLKFSTGFFPAAWTRWMLRKIDAK